MVITHGRLIGILFSAILIPAAAGAQELVGLRADTDAEYSPYIQHDFPNQVLFGDTHLHTAWSAQPPRPMMPTGLPRARP